MKHKTFLGLLKYAEGLVNMTQKIKSITTSGGVTKLTFDTLLDFGGTTSLKIYVNGKTAVITMPDANYKDQWETTDTLTSAEVGKSVQRFTPISAVSPEDIPNFGQVMGAITTAVMTNAPIIGLVNSEQYPPSELIVAATSGYRISAIQTFIGKEINGTMQYFNLDADIEIDTARTSATIYSNCYTGTQLLTLMTLTQII